MDGWPRYLTLRAMGELLSAGHMISPSLKRAIERESYRIAFSGLSSDQLIFATGELLNRLGFASPVVPLWQDSDSSPRAGHAVRLLGDWSGAKAGDILALSGARDWRAKAFTIGRGRHYWAGDDASHVSLSSGGPASILKLKASALTRAPDGETAPVSFWVFKNHPSAAANTGVDYVRQMPLWLWQPNESDWLEVTSEEG